jgi:hypothetical protein
MISITVQKMDCDRAHSIVEKRLSEAQRIEDSIALRIVSAIRFL